MGRMLYIIELWEMITGKKAPAKYTKNHYRFFRSSNPRITQEDYDWLVGIAEEIVKWNPEKHGYTCYRAKFLGCYYQRDGNDN